MGKVHDKIYKSNDFKYFAVRVLFTLVVIVLCWNIYFITIEKNASNDQLIEDELELTNEIEIMTCNLSCPAPPKPFDFEEIECFQFPKSSAVPVQLFEDVLESSRQPTPGNTIFFIETTCNKDGAIHLSPREACAIESAAFHHPNRDIFVLNAALVGYPKDERLVSPVVKALQKYRNIHFRHVNVQKYVMNTPVQKWFETGELFTSTFMNVHLSDFLRLLTMYRFGGTYFDLDFIILHNLDNLQPNFLGLEDNTSVGNSVVNFSPDGIGHEMASIILQEFAEKYNGSRWAWNGPELFSRVATRICRTENLMQFSRERCVGFDVHPHKVFYPVIWQRWRQYFYESSAEMVLNQSIDSVAVHTWGSQSRNNHQTVNEPKSAYSILAETHCSAVNFLNLNIFESY